MTEQTPPLLPQAMPLFEMTRQEKRRNAGETAKRPTVVGWAVCPRCRAGERTAVIRDSGHLVYRRHDYRTYHGSPVECLASWQRLCELKPKPWHGPGAIGRCICGRI